MGVIGICFGGFSGVAGLDNPNFIFYFILLADLMDSNRVEVVSL
jgi:hypothetical protein